MCFVPQAVNVAGVGPFSDAVLCQTPCSVPAPVSNVHALRDSEMRVEDGRATEIEEDEEARTLLYSPSTCLGLRWEAPCDHGSEITSYLIDLGERQPILTGPVTKYIIQNLQPDTTYRYNEIFLYNSSKINIQHDKCGPFHECGTLKNLIN